MAPSASSAVALAPSVQEAYRRKSIQLKQRTRDVEDANDAARLRLNRIKRQVQKLRLERAFLLDQLAKRTSTAVDDSDPSPSPPPNILWPSASDFAKPSDPKELAEKLPQSKRGGARKRPSLLPDTDKPAAGASFATDKTNAAASPGSDSCNPARPPPPARAKLGRSSLRPNVTRIARPDSAFALYCADVRSDSVARHADHDSVSVAASAVDDDDLVQAWRDLAPAQRDEYQARHDRDLARYHSARAGSSANGRRPRQPDGPNDDVDMLHYDTEDQDTQVDEKTDD